jgi:hypothetical protein
MFACIEFMESMRLSGVDLQCGTRLKVAGAFELHDDVVLALFT